MIWILMGSVVALVAGIRVGYVSDREDRPALAVTGVLVSVAGLAGIIGSLIAMHLPLEQSRCIETQSVTEYWGNPSDKNQAVEPRTFTRCVRWESERGRAP